MLPVNGAPIEGAGRDLARSRSSVSTRTRWSCSISGCSRSPRRAAVRKRSRRRRRDPHARGQGSAGDRNRGCLRSRPRFGPRRGSRRRVRRARGRATDRGQSPLGARQMRADPTPERALRIHTDEVERCRGWPRMRRVLYLRRKGPHALQCRGARYRRLRDGCRRDPGCLGAGASSTSWVDETRPLLQGARLTAVELEQLGIPMRSSSTAPQPR